jgi:hypothetical protein
VNETVNDAPFWSGSEEKVSGEPGSETMVCATPSWLTQVTVLPVFTASEEGVNAKFLMEMEFTPPVDTGAPDDTGTAVDTGAMAETGGAVVAGVW